MKNTTTENQNTDMQDMNDAKEIPLKQLGCFIIYDFGEDNKHWLTVCDTGEPKLSTLTGEVIKYDNLDLTWLSSWKARSPASELIKSYEDYEAFLMELPAWDETKWAIISGDSDCDALIDCRTGALDSESNEAKAKIKQLREHFEAEARLKGEVKIGLN